MNTLDSLRAARSSPFCILVQISKADFSYVIAVGTSEQEIEADWAWLEENLVGVLGERGEGRKGVGGEGGRKGRRRGRRVANGIQCHKFLSVAITIRIVAYHLMIIQRSGGIPQ